MSFDCRFNGSSSIVLSGASGTGKTELLSKMIKNQQKFFKETFDNIFCVYRVYQPAYRDWAEYCPVATFYRNGMPDEKLLDGYAVLDRERHSLLICDDMDDDPAVFPLLVKMFTTLW